MSEYPISILSELEAFVYAHEESFLETFARMEATDLLEIGFGSTHIRIVFLQYSGAHISDTITVADFLVWKESQV